ncbi:VWA domain-containing protein [Collinsella aerofaciens]|uniref:VWA domain-containing protein n=3 Tax=Collinsella aerofaciens TaxID=74426 RepID=A0AAW6AHK6_9ACTN|nr:FctA domain-containing protein [Collinsella aerofaciens]MDB1837160.1 VWA domain-containing protein [Collinsella aerofaciens]MDB1838312.1 VWA domain-containing protein [Collinsella aerofaciens]MDB1841073.1 VWA domain-containing protein [Collinsella aerofaciens]MDB1842978.1 VWA domain-containing protein [Collinsella aerofaciens]MDB1844663.1 VWA domain-containing protein [Collinsella aerofaciens]
MSRYTRGLLAAILAVVLVLPAAAFAMLPEANARSSTGMDGPEATKIVDHDTSNHWKFWAGGYDGSKVTTQNVGRIWTDKTVQAIDDGKSDFLTTLSAMSSTSDTTSLVSKPLDIVMVLDASGSMDDPMGGEDSPKRIDALKNAANHFIDTIAEQNKNVKDASKQHQVAIVKFAGEKTDKIGNDTYRDGRHSYNYSQTMQKLMACSGDGAKSLKKTINSIDPAGATRADNGMALAEGITSKREDAQKIVVFFTDGTPTDFRDFSSTVADNAIAAAEGMKDKGATVYTIGIFDGADPSADPTSYKTSDENKFMHAMSSNYPKATSYTSGKLGDRVAGATYYKSAANAAELDQVFADISSAITSGKGFPTKVEGNNPNGSGYITFEDELGAFMQVDSFTGAEYNGKTYGAATKSTDGNIDTYTFDGELAHLVITVDRADENNPQRGDIVTVKVPASLIPLRRFTVDESAGTFVVDSTEAISPIRVAYASSVKAIARKNLFTPNNVPGLQDYINEHKDADSNTVSFYANKWTGDDAGDTVASFEPAATNSYYYFQKLTPVYTDAACTKLATEKPSGSKTYWYKDEFMAQNSSGAPYDDSVSIPVKGSELENFEGALVKDGDHWSIKAGTARLAFINQLHTTKERVGGNPTDTARDVINPQWNNTKVVSGATKVNVYLGNNGKISFTLNTTPTTLTTADFGLTKVLEGRDWTDEDKFEFGLTSEDNAPMPRSTTAFATKGHADISFGEIAYDKPGTYVYKVSEKHAGTTVDGIAYSKNVAESTVTVTPNAKGKLEASVKKTSGEVEFKNTYTANPAESSVTDQITVTKVLTGHKLQDNEFSFELVEGEGEDASVVETVKNDANGNVAFSAIKYTEIGQHIYTLREVKGNAGGIAYDKTVYTVVTTIADNGKGQLVATHKLKGAEDVKKIEFKNSYTVTPKSSSVTDQITATKSLTGRKLAAGEFSFELVEGDKVVATGTNDASGNITMGTVKYDKAGTHAYTLREVNGGTTSKGIAYDGKTYTIVTTITDKGDGTLKAEHVLKDAKAAEFKNSYNLTPTESSVTDQVKATKFLTGRALAAGEFSFELVEGDKVVATGTNDASGNITMGAVKYTEAGKHTYTLREAKGGTASKGVSYDAKTYTVVTTVTDRGDGTLAVKHELKDAGTAEFKNSYTVTPEDSSVTDQVTATKFLDGRDLKAGEFRFELVEGNNVVATGTNNADGKIVMDPVTYTAAGEHIYTLREVKGGTTSKGITYSDAKYTIETTITDNGDGTLKAEHVLKGTEPAEFKNSYSVTPLDAGLDFDLNKVISGREWTDGDEFSFTITAPDGAPLPDPATVTVSKHDAKDGIAAIKFGKIRYTVTGTYKYEIRENAGSTVGMTYDTHVATAEVTVTENGDGSLTANVTKKESGRFTNTYRTELNYTAAGGLWLSKYLDGRPMPEGQFTFTVTPADDASARALGLLPGANSFKSPAAAEATVGLIDILAGHEVIFTQADAGKTFTYTVAEKNDGQPGYTYDDAVRTVTIAIADDTAGTLTATTTVSGGPEGTHETVHKSGENKVEKALVPFHNSYSATTNTPGGTAAQVVATKTLTGRPMADGEFWFGIAYQGELVAYENLKPNIGGHVSFDTLHYDTKMLANLEAAGLAYRTDKDGKLAWTINYTAYEDLFGLPNGVSATTWSFGFKVIVVDNGDGTLTATVDYGGVEPLFENVYGAEAVDAALTGTKKLQAAEGLTPADITGKFTFTVTADEAGAPMPERTTVTNDAAGNVDFGKINFTLEDLNHALGVTDDATDKAEADEADEAEADEAEAEEADAGADADTDESNDESEPAAPTAPRSHTFTYTVTESGSAPGVTNDANAMRKVSYTVTDDGTGHLRVVRNGDDGAAFTFTNTYSVTPTDSVVTDQVKTVKRLTGRDLAAGEFTFELLEDGVVVASGTNDADGNVTLNPIRYETPGTHTYTLREACPNALGLYKGVTYDSTTYTVVTTVSDNGDGTLTATHKLEGTTESAGFTNKYHAMPTQVSIGAIKVLEGRELKKDEFSFKLVGEDVESTVTNDADGKISFDKFEYNEPGTYVYTISEVKGDEAGMTYDKSVFTATVNVADDGEGNLKANVAFAKGDKSVEGIVFNNTYKKPETPVPTPDPGTPKTVTNIVKTVKGFLPTTGDQQAAALLMAFVIATAGVGALVWGIRKR